MKPTAPILPHISKTHTVVTGVTTKPTKNTMMHFMELSDMSCNANTLRRGIDLDAIAGQCKPRIVMVYTILSFHGDVAAVHASKLAAEKACRSLNLENDTEHFYVEEHELKG